VSFIWAVSTNCAPPSDYLTIYCTTPTSADGTVDSRTGHTSLTQDSGLSRLFVYRSTGTVFMGDVNPPVVPRACNHVRAFQVNDTCEAAAVVDLACERVITRNGTMGFTPAGGVAIGSRPQKVPPPPPPPQPVVFRRGSWTMCRVCARACVCVRVYPCVR
jgi:hypothetical protein